MPYREGVQALRRMVVALQVKVDRADRLASAVRAALGHPSTDSDAERQMRTLLFEYLDG